MATSSQIQILGDTHTKAVRLRGGPHAKKPAAPLPPACKGACCCPAPAATTAKGPSGQTSPGRSITVQKGESIDAVIRRGLPGLALRDDFMRQALARANPRIFPKGQTYPVKPGTVLTLPSHEDLRQHILSQYPATVALFQASPAENVGKDQASGPDKRRWVRFP